MTPYLVPVLLGVTFVGTLVAYVMAIQFCVADARRRGKSPVLVAVLVALLFPWGLVAWLLFRPDPPDQTRTAPFRLEDYRVQ